MENAAEASDGPTSAAVKVSGVGRTFRLGRRELVALQGISFGVRDGEFVSIIGPSGCGKSTLLRLIAGLIAPSSGSISIGESTVREARAARKFGFVFQEPTLLPWRSALQNVTLLLELARRGSAAERRARGIELLELVGLGQFVDTPPAKLSGGMQRRVGIARALAVDPQIVLLDEPFGALDEITRQQMNVFLQSVWTAQRTTALLVTHNVGEAVFLSDRVIVMSNGPGRIVGELQIDLPRPRDLTLLQDQRYFALAGQLTQMLFTSGVALQSAYS